MPDPFNRRTEACDDGAHDRCPHFSSSGTSFNMLQLRVESGMALCQCSCHSACPVATSVTPPPVPTATWYELCSCPGAEPTRRAMQEAGLDPREVSRQIEEARRKTRARKEAFNAARARSAGKSQEVLEIYTAELRARGLDAGAEPRTDADVAWIAGNPLPMLLLQGKGLVRIGKGVRDFVKLVKQGVDDPAASGEQRPGQEQPPDR